MTKKDKKYRLSGRSFSKQELTALCRIKVDDATTKDFEKEICLFILEWFSPQDHLLVSTSGSTGKPKEINLLKKHMEVSARATISFFGLKPGDTVLHCLPMRYIAGKMMVVRALVGGLDLYAVEPSSEPEIIPDKVTFSALVPLQLSRLLQNVPGRQSLEKIDKLIVGGAFVPESLEQSIQEISTQIWQTYGMTETITHIALRKLNGAGRSDWYKPLPDVSVRLNENNCLVIDAPDIGVENLATNDLARTEGTEKFKIIGRTDHVIISGGVKLHPEEIEQKISGICSNAYFIGSKPDAELGQKLVLFIENGEGVERRIFYIWQLLEKRLSLFEIPKEIIFVPVFKRTATGKIDRKI